MSLLRESSVYVASSCVVNAGAFLLIPVLTRILSPAEYGILGGIGVFAALLSIVMPLGLHGAVARFYYDYRERHGELRCYVSTIVMTVLASSFQSGMGMVSDLEQGMLDKFLISPIHRSSVLIGKVMSDGTRMMLQGKISRSSRTEPLC